MAAVCVFCASSDAIDPAWRQLAGRFGAQLASRGHTLVSGGGQVGMMGTVARGTRSGGAHTLGVIAQCLVIEEVVDADSDELITTVDLTERKAVMMAKADAFAILPGGIGTLDEFFEVWTTAALGVHDKPVVLLDIDNFYTGLLDWLRRVAAAGFITPRALSALTVVTSADAALAQFDALDRGGAPVG